MTWLHIKPTRLSLLTSTITIALCSSLVGCNDDHDKPITNQPHDKPDSRLKVETQPFGWGSMFIDSEGKPHATTGGEGAAQESIYMVTNRQELHDALNNIRSNTYIEGDDPEAKAAQLAAKLEPKIIYWQGTIYGDECDESIGDCIPGERLANPQEYYQTHPNRTKFDFDLYAKGFDSSAMQELNDIIEVGGDECTNDELCNIAQEEKDLISRQNGQRGQYANNQKAQIQFIIPPNTTILGVGNDAKLVEGSMSIITMNPNFGPTENSNIIVRNITFQAPRDFAPAWDAGDEDGNWNARYDAISINTGKNIWIDHCTFTDGEYPDIGEPILPENVAEPAHAKHVQRHDGLVDVEDAADFITFSYNIFESHDKTMLIGSGDGDIGNYRITFTGNLWRNSTQRSPRVRYGQVHLYNNLYEGTTDESPVINDGYPIMYAIGMGYRSSILSEHNAFNYQGADRDESEYKHFSAAESSIIGYWHGTEFKDNGSWYNGQPAANLNQIALDKCRTAQEEEHIAGTKSDEAAHTDWIDTTCTNTLRWKPLYSYTLASSADELETFVHNNAGAGKITIELPN